MQIFDFTSRRSMSPGSSAAVITHIDGVKRVERRPGGKQEAAPLLVMPVGDALQEPFWPEGLGTNRGVHNARDTAVARRRCDSSPRCSSARARAARLHVPALL
eukprot:2545137-Prymnesium_polylepis.1